VCTIILIKGQIKPGVGEGSGEGDIIVYQTETEEMQQDLEMVAKSGDWK
jgi:hypothetical protein